MLDVEQKKRNGDNSDCLKNYGDKKIDPHCPQLIGHLRADPAKPLTLVVLHPESLDHALG
ncbi:MAG UNVERIFIED_CONTAM: hypothetical protein LVR18_42485 [Planctomycetaceae bacterium]